MNRFKKIFIGLGLLSLALFSVGVGVTLNQVQETGSLGGNILPDAKWVMYNQFTGYQTKADPNKIDDGGNPQGQNTSINNGDRISPRVEGTTVFPSGFTTTSSSGISTMHTFRRRNGQNVLMAAYGTNLQYYDEANDVWEVLNTGYTEGYDFGFGDYNINTDQISYVYFGNSQEPFSRWTGAITHLNGVLSGGEATINVDDTTELAASGTAVICGTEVTYSGKTATSLTGASSTPACADNKAVTQAVQEYASNPRGNIYLVADNRLFIAGVTSTPQAIYFSQYGDATDFLTTSLVTDTTAEDSGIFNLGEGGGGVVAMLQEEESLYFFKKSIVYRAVLSDSLYTLKPLKPFDGKSQTTGAISTLSTFAGGNGLFFITPDRQIMNLTRADNIDYPQLIPVSDPIKPTADNARYSDAVGIYWKDKAYIATRASSNSTYNDVVFVYNYRVNAWESPIIGWNVADWAIYDDGTGESLYFGSVNSPTVYKVNFDGPLDDVYGVSANWRSKQFDFGLPQSMKEIDNVFIEGYISDNTTLSISLLLDENGFTQTYTTDFVGTETDYLFNASSFNLFGLTPFGTERFGSNDDFSGKKKFRIYLNKDFRRVPFYTAQIEFASDQESAQWEVTSYGFYVRESSQNEDRTLYRAFK